MAKQSISVPRQGKKHLVIIRKYSWKRDPGMKNAFQALHRTLPARLGLTTGLYLRNSFSFLSLPPCVKNVWNYTCHDYLDHPCVYYAAAADDLGPKWHRIPLNVA
ncbi:hypothetical protein V6N13_079366 [Hibiscus sabdariffa]|uniref:Uncharacterized protein n=1 Tax=Hibiscus sabdariffa TaxID=183260 RepID=A0ABR2RRM6_9ROSI